MSEYICRVIIEPQEEGGFTAYVPSLPGCVSQGATYQETLDNIREALELCPEATKERNETIVPERIRITVFNSATSYGSLIALRFTL